MTDMLNEAQQKLTDGGHALVLRLDDRELVSDGKGIRPLLSAVEDGGWSGAYAADRIVGKAAAMLYVVMGAQAVYAEVLSESAKEILEQNSICCRYGTLTDRIINRTGTGLCPMELAVEKIDCPDDAPAAIREKLNNLP